MELECADCGDLADLTPDELDGGYTGFRHDGCREHTWVRVDD